MTSLTVEDLAVNSGPDVYQKKAIATRARRAAADKRIAAEFAERQRLFNEKLDAIRAAKKAGAA